MGTFKINTREMILEAFGYKGLVNIPAVMSPTPGTANIDKFTEVSTIDDTQKTNLLGLPVFSSLNFEKVSDDKKLHPGMSFDDVLIDISQEKRIVQTPLQNPDEPSDVIEGVSSGNFNVRIMGLLVAGQIDKNENLKGAPDTEIKYFADLMKINTALPVNCKLFEWFGIYSLVVKSWSSPNAGSMVNVRPFEIDCISDMPIDLILKNTNNV
jgi:hypothetical protein